MKRLLAALLVTVALASGSQLLIACGGMEEVAFDQYITANPNVDPATIVYNPTTGQYGAYWDAWHAQAYNNTYTQPALVTVSNTTTSTSSSSSTSTSTSPVMFEPPVPVSRTDPVADVIPQVDLVPVLGGDLNADMGIAAEVM